MTGLSLHSAAFDYLDAMRAEGTPHNTVKQYRSVLMRLCARYPKRKYAGITTQDLAAFLYGPKGITTGKSSSVGIGARAALRSFFAYGQLMAWSRTPVHVPQPVMRQRPAARKLATRLSAMEMIVMLDEAPSPIVRAMIAVATNTALRISDILKMRVGDIDLQRGEVNVIAQKTAHVDDLPVTLDLDDELRRYLSWYSARVPVTDETYMFPGWQLTGRTEEGPVYEMDPTRPASYGYAKDKLHEVYEACGIAVQTGEAWHLIRRSVARIYFDSLRFEISYDHALRQTASLLGHKSDRTTEKYLGLSTEIAARNESLRGKSLLGAAAPNVVPMPRTATSRSAERRQPPR